MSGVHRLLSKRHAGEKHHHLLGRHHADDEKEKTSLEIPPRSIDLSSPVDFYGLFDLREKTTDHNEEHKVQSLRKRILEKKGVMFKDPQLLWALRSRISQGKEDKAFEFLIALSDASEGLVAEYNSEVKLLGAENRHAVTCYLDSILFAMFSRLESFEAMLYNTFEDGPRNRLAFLLRLWVNLLRTGQLITSDITKMIQEAIAQCGWPDALKLCQQDASEAFTFITGKLELPLLTLKMDIYHTGKEDANDDHKFINERLLEVAIPQDLAAEKGALTLEDCLEEYFNNRIEVRRYLERRSTGNSTRSYDMSRKSTSGIHIETVELGGDDSPTTPLSASPSHNSFSRPSIRHRAPSIIQERFVPDRSASELSSLSPMESRTSSARTRAGSVRKEVMMPAWQFFSLIPWYTDHAPSSDAQVASHFSSRRPVLGLCLKRYAMTNTGKPIRLNTPVDVPIEIGLPHFIQDDHMEDEGPIYGNFKLSLQSVVCHRGNSVNSGHYICLTRTTTTRQGSDAQPSADSLHWMRFDDLANQRITLVDIEKALREETPYLLFYQIVPIDGDPGHITDGEHAPIYSAAPSDGSMTSLTLRPSRDSGPAIHGPSIEISRPDDPFETFPGEMRRASVTFSEPFDGRSSTLVDNRSTSRPSTRGTSPTGRKSHSLSRIASKTIDDGGLAKTLSLSKLTGGRGKEPQPTGVVPSSEVHVRDVSNPVSAMDDARSRPAYQPRNFDQKTHKREKSRSRLSKHGTGKAREKPDRECIVM